MLERQSKALSKPDPSLSVLLRRCSHSIIHTRCLTRIQGALCFPLLVILNLLEMFLRLLLSTALSMELMAIQTVSEMPTKSLCISERHTLDA